MVVCRSTGGRWAGNFDLVFLACETCKKVDCKAAKNDTYNYYLKWRRWCAKAVLKLWIPPPSPPPPHRPSAFVEMLWLAGFQSKCNACFLEEELPAAQTYAIVKRTLRVSVIASLNMVNLSVLGYSVLTHFYAWDMGVCGNKVIKSWGPKYSFRKWWGRKRFWFNYHKYYYHLYNKVCDKNHSSYHLYKSVIKTTPLITYVSVIKTTPLITYISLW